MAVRTCELLIAGGGLAGGLIALALADARPDLDVLLVEREERLGGNHIWSFFDSDLDAAGKALVAPLVGHRWPAYDVAFPKRRRTIAQPYNSIESERFDVVLRERLPPDRILTGVEIAALDPAGATLADGSRIAAAGVIDARGAGDLAALDLGWQKFVGRLLRLDAPHGLERPTIMDATVDQADGYRFVYLLPFGPDRIFVEDTYYATDPILDIAAIEARIADYAAGCGWRIAAIERGEAAALPIAEGGDLAGLLAGPVARAGMAAGLFQPMTGYSLPDAVRAAQTVARSPDFSTAALRNLLHDYALRRWKGARFYRLLARLIFRAAEPAQRYKMLQHFYGLDEDLIGRFYAGRSTRIDRARILCGRPPVPIAAALRVMAGAA